MPAAKLRPKVAVNPLWSTASILHQCQRREAAVGRSKWKDGLSFDTRLAPGLWPVHGAGTNFKVGAPVQRKALKKIFGRAPPLFDLKVQLVVLVSAFVVTRDGQ